MQEDAVAATGALSRAYENFWARLLERIHHRHPDWPVPGSPPPRNWLPFGRELSWFTYGLSFGHQGLCSELYIRVPGEAMVGQRMLSYLQARSGELEQAYGGRLRYEDLPRLRSGRTACRLADYRPGSVRDDGGHDAYLEWFLDSQERLHAAVQAVGGLAALRSHAGQ